MTGENSSKTQHNRKILQVIDKIVSQYTREEAKKYKTTLCIYQQMIGEN